MTSLAAAWTVLAALATRPFGWVLPVGSLFLVFAAAWALANRIERWRWTRAMDPPITPLGPRHYRFTGYDQQLARRTAERRAAADRARSEARRIDSEGRSTSLLREVTAASLHGGEA